MCILAPEEEFNIIPILILSPIPNPNHYVLIRNNYYYYYAMKIKN